MRCTIHSGELLDLENTKVEKVLDGPDLRSLFQQCQQFMQEQRNFTMTDYAKSIDEFDYRLREWNNLAPIGDCGYGMYYASVDPPLCQLQCTVDIDCIRCLLRAIDEDISIDT